jgi:hypothetical protein
MHCGRERGVISWRREIGGDEAMGGPGAGHKSWRAQAARRVNIQKARAARKRAPLPWRSGLESRVIEQLVWQWWKQKTEAAGGYHGGERPFDINQGKPSGCAQGKPSGVDWGKPSGLARGRRFGGARSKQFGFGQNKPFIHHIMLPGVAQGKPKAEMPAYRLARLLGVSHTWVNKLAKKFEADPERARRRNGAFAPATLTTLERAREETRWQREHGRLRGPMPRRTAKNLSRKKKSTARDGEHA